MFGFVTANIVDLSDDEKSRYKAFYCGLCHVLKERSGTMSRLCLSYDLTFLVMLLGSLYEPSETQQTVSCPTNPLKRRDAIITKHTAYAADMAVALTYHKCLDDWNDDRKFSAHQMTRLLDKPYRVAAQRWPRQCRAIEDGLARIGAIERGMQPDAKAHAQAAKEPTYGDAQVSAQETEESGPDEAARLFGSILGTVFTFDADDIWGEPLWRLGAKLGRFIYFMDAAVDLDSDIKHDSYNPFRHLELDVESQRVLLMHLIGEAADEFERLPLERDLHAMRSVLYAGVWQQFYAKHDLEEAPPGESGNEAATELDEGQQ